MKSALPVVDHCCKCRTIWYVGPLINLVKMHLYGAFRKIELTTYLLVRETPGNKDHDFTLSRRKLRSSRRILVTEGVRRQRLELAI